MGYSLSGLVSFYYRAATQNSCSGGAANWECKGPVKESLRYDGSFLHAAPRLWMNKANKRTKRRRFTPSQEMCLNE